MGNTMSMEFRPEVRLFSSALKRFKCWSEPARSFCRPAICKVVAVVLAFGWGLAGCCENEAPVEFPSPDGYWKYVLFDRNCGATTRSNYQLSVLSANERLPNRAANTFIADDNRGVARFVAQPAWISGHVLQITYSAKARLFKKETRVGDVEIKYIVEP